MRTLISFLTAFVIMFSGFSLSYAQDFTTTPTSPGTTVTPPTSTPGTSIYSGRFSENRQGRYSFSNVVNNLLPQAARWIAGFLAALGVLFLIYAGFQYITAEGEPDKIAQASKTALYVIAGLLLSMFAYAIVYLILTFFTPGT